MCHLALTRSLPMYCISAFVDGSWMGKVSRTMPKRNKELELCLPVKEVEELKGKGRAEG